jgi:uncharacterized repeat protein (TIGR03837 family)
MNKRWDIFCKVIDNFGDIGVCWRLAKQLHDEYALDVRLWVDDLNVASKIVTSLDASRDSQKINGVEVCLWRDEASFVNVMPADVVIEAFACELPSPFIRNMVAQKPIWLNLEYLSAEAWVDNFHAKSAIHPATGLRKTFFFPGFTNKTGGLIREKNLIAKREAAKAEFKRLPSLQVSLFCYPHAPLQSLLHAMAEGEHSVECFVPKGSAIGKIAEFFGRAQIEVGDTLNKQQMTLTVLPFLTQEEYDQLLWCCDLNFVRGEDSWIRALWSAQPFIWQTYPQDESLHLTKLDAFLDKYQAKQDDVLYEFHHAWLDTEITPKLWNQLITGLPALKEHAELQTQKFEQQADLAAKLVIFTKNKV